MENSRHNILSRQRLESLSTSELIKMADGYGIDIPTGLERIFIIEELLEFSADENQEEQEDDLQAAPEYLDTAAMPKQYNISYIDVMIRDPLWVFVFWEIKSHDREMHENAEDFNGYCLRVMRMNEDHPSSEAVSKENSFAVTIENDDSARYIGFTEDHCESRYVIKLCVIRGSEETQLAVSAPFHMPRLMENNSISGISKNPLIHLSGASELSIIKSMDRKARSKRQ